MAIAVSGTTWGRVFSASPYYIKITGLTPITGYAELSRTEATFSIFSRKRYANSVGEIMFPLNDFFKSYFRNVEFGDVLPATTGYANSASKLINSDIINYGLDLNINGTHYTSLTFSVIYGALQVGETESTEETIYAFGDLPLTITQNIGDYVWDNDGEELSSNFFGKDIDISKVIHDYPHISTIKIQTLPSTTHKTFNIEKSSCTDGTYLRWIYQGQYRYFLFKLKDSFDDTKQGDSFKKELLSLESTANGLYKGQSQLMTIEGNHTEIVGIATASYEQQKYIKTIQQSIKVWKYLGTNQWVEVGIKMNPITLDEIYQQPKQIELTVISPDLFIPSL
jgi:hypothetical protein